jgi:hypothetical protein
MTDPNQPNPQHTPPSAPPAYEAPAYPNAPQYGAGAPADAPVPGKTMAIVALILAIVPGTQLIGLILGIIALVQSRKAGRKNGMAVAAIIVSIVLMIIAIIVIVLIVSFAVSAGGDLVTQVNACLEDPSGTVTWQGVTMTCEELLESNGY